MDINTATPAQVDTEIARLNGVIETAWNDRQDALDFIAKRDAAADYERDGFPWFSQAKADQATATITAATAAIEAAQAEVAPLNDRYTVERWTRFYLVTNTGGHVHFTTACGTCFPTTQFAWLTDYSGMSHADFVQEAGALACTVCFPGAPVEQVTRIKYEAADKRAAREAREAKAAAKNAAKVVVTNWIDYGRVSDKTFGTERAVTNAISGAITSLITWGTDHPTSQEWLSQIEAARAALAARGTEYDYDKALDAARKRIERECKREGYTYDPKF